MVAQVQQFVQFESFIANRIFLYVNLKFLPALLQVGKASLAHQANCHQTPGHAHVHPRLIEFLRRLIVVRPNLFYRVRDFVFAAVHGLAERFNLLQLVAAQIVNFIVECQWVPLSCGRYIVSGERRL